MHGPNAKHSLWLLIETLMTKVGQLIAWGIEMEQAFVDGVTDIAELQPKLKVLGCGKLAY